jgi:hypothetical protein
LRVEQDATIGGEKGASEVIVPGAKAQKIKETTTLALDFDKSDDEVHDEEAKHDRVSRLSESTINVRGCPSSLKRLFLHVIFFTSRIFILFVFF